jgi:hypothetical protein
MSEINPRLPQPKPWAGAQGIPSGESRAHLSVQAQQRQLTQSESAVATHLGVSGIPIEAAGKLAVIILELRSQVEYLQARVRELAGE